MDTASNPIVVLVHGAWADGSSWQRVIPLLQAEGLSVVAVQNPTTSLADDAAATKRALDAAPGPVVLVGHSWGGAVITEAGNHDKVKALVFVAAFAPKAGETLGALVGAHPAPPALGKISDDGTGFLKISEQGWIEDVANDLPEAEAKVLAAVQPPLAANTFNDMARQAAWESRPCWYLVSTDDRVVNVDLERAFAAQIAAKTTELKAGHLSLLSQPQAVAAAILEAVAAVRGG